MLILQFFFQKCDQGAPLRKMQIKGNLAKYMNFERVYKSRLIVGERIILWRKKRVVKTKKCICIYAKTYKHHVFYKI